MSTAAKLQTMRPQHMWPGSGFEPVPDLLEFLPHSPFPVQAIPSADLAFPNRTPGNPPARTGTCNMNGAHGRRNARTDLPGVRALNPPGRNEPACERAANNPVRPSSDTCPICGNPEARRGAAGFEWPRRSWRYSLYSGVSPVGRESPEAAI